MGRVQSSIGQPGKARASIERASAIYSDLLRPDPGQPEHRRGLARCLLILGVLDHQAGRPVPALDLLRKARDELEQLLPLSKEPSALRAEMVMCYIDAGGVEEVMGRFADALADYRKALSIADRLVRENPAVAAYQLDQAQPTATSARFWLSPASRPRPRPRSRSHARSSNPWSRPTRPPSTTRAGWRAATSAWVRSRR